MSVSTSLPPAFKAPLPPPGQTKDTPKSLSGKGGPSYSFKDQKNVGDQKKTVDPNKHSGSGSKSSGNGGSGDKSKTPPSPSPTSQGPSVFLSETSKTPSPSPTSPSPKSPFPTSPPPANPNGPKLSGLSTQANTLTQGLDPSAAAQIDQPLQVAQDLEQNWNAWGLHQGVDFGHPPAGLPAQAYADFKAIAGSPALRTALSGGTGATLMTLASVTNFAGRAAKDLTAGGAAYAAYLAANPNASASSKDLARQAAIMDANLTLFSANGDGRPSIDDVNRGASDPGLGAVIKNAAALFGKPGLFQELDSAGQNPLTTVNDGVLNQDNVTAWLKAAPIADDDFQSLMTQASLMSAVSGFSTAGLTGDVLANPSHYSAGQKAAVLLQLEQGLNRYQLGLKNGQTVYANDGAAMRHLTDAIGKLSQESDVGNFLSNKSLSGLQMIGQNPLLNADVTATFNTFKTTAQLQSDLSNDVNNGIAPREALEKFLKGYNFYSNALTLSNGSHGPAINSAADIISNNPSLYNAILTYWKNYIVNSQELSNLIADGMDPAAAIQQFTGDVSLVGSLIPPDTRANLIPTVESSFMDVMANHVLSSGTTSDLTRAFADAGGNLDQAKLTQELQQAMQQNPSVFTDENGKPVSPDQVVNAFKYVWEGVRSGAKITDSLGKLGYPGLGNQTIQGHYGKGVLHAVSALFGAGVLSAKGATGADAVSIEATALSTFGLALEAGTRYVSKVGGSGLTNDQLKILESGGGKIVGGLGSALTGALGVMGGIKDLSSGDTAGATINLSTGISGLIAAGGTAGEGAVGLAAAAGVEGLADIAAGISVAVGGLSIFGGVVGLAGFLAMGAVSNIRQQEISDKFDQRVTSVFQQYGIATG